MIDSIGTLRLELPGAPGVPQRAGPAAAAAVAFAAAASGPITSTSARADGRVVLVRRLRLDLPVPARGEAEELAAAAGRELEPALRRCLAGPQPGIEMLSFESEAEYLVHFLEQFLRGRPVDAWYFRPLARCIAATLAETLGRLAEAEPGAWPAVIRLLRVRGLMAPLLRRLEPHWHPLLRGDVPGPPRVLAPDEARPLFHAAWAIAVAALTGGTDAVTRAEATRELALSGAGPRAAPREEALRAYLASGPAPPRSWAAPDALGRSVAAMVEWILARTKAAELDTGAAVAELDEHRWLAHAPVRAALSAAAGRIRRTAASPRTGTRGAGTAGTRTAAAAPAGESTPAGASGGGHLPASAASVSMNRTRALRYLVAARSTMGRSTRLRAGLAAYSGAGELEGSDLDEAAAILARSAEALSAEAVEAWLRGAGELPDPRVGATPALARLRAAASRLIAAEVRELASHLHAVAVVLPRPGITTNAVGVFLLVRPLIDLQVMQLSESAGVEPVALREILRLLALLAAGDDAESVVAHIIAHGVMPGLTRPALELPRRALVALTSGLRTRAAALRLPKPAALDVAGDPDPADATARLLLDIACCQLVRWMHGLEASSTAFVLRQLVRRTGSIDVPLDGPVVVEWRASGYDVLLERAGYLHPLDTVPWWNDRGVRWLR